MRWIRQIEEPPEHRRTDVAVLAVATGSLLLLGLGAQTRSPVDVNLFRAVNGLGDGLDWLAKPAYALGSPWALVVVLVALATARRWPVVVRLAIGGIAVIALDGLVHRVLGSHPVGGLGIHERLGDGPAFASANVAVITTMAMVLSPYVVRPLRRLLLLLIVVIALAAMYLGTAFPADVVGGLLMGVAVAALVRVAFGAPSGRPTIAEVRDALGDLGYHAGDVRLAEEHVRRAAAMDVTVDGGRRLRVDAFGRDQHEAGVPSRAWHWLMYKEPGVPVFGSRLQQVEHIAYTLLLAQGGHVNASRLVKTGVGGDDAALLITERPAGTPLADLPGEAVNDEVLAEAWTQLGRLHTAGISHCNLGPLRVVVGDDATVALDDFSAADASGHPYWYDRDDAALLVTTALQVGNDRAVSAALAGLGADRLAEIIPVIQPAALPDHVGKGVKHLAKSLKELRAHVVSATGAEDVPPLKIRRLSLVNIGMLAGVLIALAVAIPSLKGVDWTTVKTQFEDADWGWVLVAAALYPLVPMSWSTALTGCVNADLPFAPTALTQLACTFLNLITPNGIGGTALQLDYLHKQGVPVASAASAMVLSSGVGGAIQMVMFLTAAAITSTSTDTTSSSSDSSGTITLLVIAVVGAAVGLVLLVPKVRGKVVPVVKRTAGDIWAVLRNPHKAVRLLGGDLGGNIAYPVMLGICLRAFHQHLDFAQLVVVQVGASMLGSVAPVPGGIGVAGAALVAGLTGFGIPSAPAVAAVFVFRAVSFAIPPVFGFVTLRWLRRRGYA